MRIKLLSALLFLVLSFVSSLSAFYRGDAITSFRLPAGATIAIDGRAEPLWQRAASLSGESGTIHLNSITQIQTSRGTEPWFLDSGSVRIFSVYDEDNLYLYILVNDYGLTDVPCDLEYQYRLENFYLMLDMSPFDSISASEHFVGVEFYPGFSANTIYFHRSILPGSIPFFYRVEDGGLEKTNIPEGLSAISIKSTTDTISLGLEVKIPWGAAASIPLPDSVYISWGYYNSIPDSYFSNCFDALPINFTWQNGYYPVDPGKDFNAWGKLILDSALTASDSLQWESPIPEGLLDQGGTQSMDIDFRSLNRHSGFSKGYFTIDGAVHNVSNHNQTSFIPSGVILQVLQGGRYRKVLVRQ